MGLFGKIEGGRFCPNLVVLFLVFQILMNGSKSRSRFVVRKLYKAFKKNKKKKEKGCELVMLGDLRKIKGSHHHC